MIHYSFDLDYLWLSYNQRISDIYDNWDLPLNDLNNRFFNKFLNLYYSFMNDWYLNDSFNLFRNFLVNLNNFGNDFFYFYDSINRHYFLDNNFHCKRSINSVSN